MHELRRSARLLTTPSRSRYVFDWGFVTGVGMTLRIGLEGSYTSSKNQLMIPCMSFQYRFVFLPVFRDCVCCSFFCSLASPSGQFRCQVRPKSNTPSPSFSCSSRSTIYTPITWMFTLQSPIVNFFRNKNSRRKDQMLHTFLPPRWRATEFKFWDSLAVSAMPDRHQVLSNLGFDSSSKLEVLNFYAHLCEHFVDLEFLVEDPNLNEGVCRPP